MSLVWKGDALKARMARAQGDAINELAGEMAQEALALQYSTLSNFSLS